MLQTSPLLSYSCLLTTERREVVGGGISWEGRLGWKSFNIILILHLRTVELWFMIFGLLPLYFHEFFFFIFCRCFHSSLLLIKLCYDILRQPKKNSAVIYFDICYNIHIRLWFVYENIDEKFALLYQKQNVFYIDAIR